MNTKKEVLYLLQVLIPFVLLAKFQHWGFLAPCAIIILSLPFQSLRVPLIKAWKGLGHFLGKFVSPIILSAIYYLMITPLAMLRKMFGSDTLHLKKPKTSTLEIVDFKPSPEQFNNLW